MAAFSGACWAAVTVLALLAATLGNAAPTDAPAEVACAVPELAPELADALPLVDDGSGGQMPEEAEEMNVMLLQTQLRLDHPAKLPTPKAVETELPAVALAQVVANLSANLDQALNRTESLLEVIANQSETAHPSSHGRAASLAARALDAFGHDSGVGGGGGASLDKDPDDPPFVMEVPSEADVPNATGVNVVNESGEQLLSVGGRTKPGDHLKKARIHTRHKDTDQEGIFIVVGLTIGVTLCVCICASDSPLRRALDNSHEKIGQTAAAFGPMAPAASAAAQGVSDAMHKP